MIHSFATKLAESQNPQNEDWWEQVYRKAFPNFVCFMPILGDSQLQRDGVDRVVALTTGDLVRTDEKVRTGYYDDILLEYVSNNRTNSPGWIEKNLKIHFIVYAFMVTGRVYFIPWQMLRLAWRTHKDQWLKDAAAERNGLALIQARNSTYLTLSVAVPVDTLIAAIAEAAAAGVLKIEVPR